MKASRIQVLSILLKLERALSRGGWLLVLLGLSACSVYLPADLAPDAITSPLPTIVTLTPCPRLTVTSSLTQTLWPTITREPTSTPIFIYTQSPFETKSISAIDAVARWLSGIPCEPPCWEGVTPGVTSGFDAAMIWSTNPLFRKVEVSRASGFGREWGNVDFEMNISSGNSAGEARYALADPQSLIYEIRLPTAYNGNLEDLISAFGPPSHVIIAVYPYADDPSDHWYVSILWMSKGLAIDRIDRGSPPEIDGELSSLWVTYFSPGLEGYKKTDVANVLTGFEYFLRPWHGYGSFEEYIVSTPTP